VTQFRYHPIEAKYPVTEDLHYPHDLNVELGALCPSRNEVPVMDDDDNKFYLRVALALSSCQLDLLPSQRLRFSPGSRW
jgi:hypothetical protein